MIHQHHLFIRWRIPVPIATHLAPENARIAPETVAIKEPNQQQEDLEIVFSCLFVPFCGPNSSFVLISEIRG